MPLSFGNRIPRPSSLPIPRHVSELVPPPYVPKELSTPSPVKPRMLFKPNRALQVQCQNKQTSPNDTSDDGRASSLSPAMAPKRVVSRMIPKSKPATGKDNKFVRSLNHNIQQSNILYQDSGKKLARLKYNLLFHSHSFFRLCKTWATFDPGLPCCKGPK